MEDLYLKSDIGMVHCCKWMPLTEPKGLVHIIHGIKEYGKRYEAFAVFMAAKGFAVIAQDHPGHGKTPDGGVDRGYLTGGWKGTVKLIRTVYKAMRKQYPELPYIMLGHSMGSFLLMSYLSIFQDSPNAAIISGCGWQSGALLAAGRAVCGIEAKRIGEHEVSGILEQLIFGGYNKRFEPARTKYDWLSTDHEVVDAYASDPLCNWSASVQLCDQMLGGIQRNQKKVNLMKMRKDLPVFFISGQQDPVGNFGNGVLKTVQAFRDAGMTDILVELYPDMRHECLNEIGKERVYEDLLTWIHAKTGCVCDKGCNL